MRLDTINQRTGGGTKYINQRDEDFLLAAFQEENYRKEFTDALKNFVDMGNFKYPLYTDKIYVSIFREKAKEYRKILRLHEKNKVRDTFYSEILDLVSAYEYVWGSRLTFDIFQQESNVDLTPNLSTLFLTIDKGKRGHSSVILFEFLGNC